MAQPAWTTVGTLSADGNTSEWVHPGGVASVMIIGTFGSGTAKLQVSDASGGTFVDVDKSGETNATLTAAGTYNVEYAPCYMRVNLASSTMPSVTVKRAEVLARGGGG